jgi:hypothetical protein
MEIAENHSCPECSQPYLKVYYSDRSGNKVGAWCEYCNMKAKILVSFRSENFRLLVFEAQQRGISVQELIRAVIVPDWVQENILSRQPVVAPTAPTVYSIRRAELQSSGSKPEQRPAYTP